MADYKLKRPYLDEVAIGLTAPVEPHELSKDQRLGFEDLVRRISAKAVMEGAGHNLLMRIYLAGIYHGATLCDKMPR